MQITDLFSVQSALRVYYSNAAAVSVWQLHCEQQLQFVTTAVTATRIGLRSAGPHNAFLNTLPYRSVAAQYSHLPRPSLCRRVLRRRPLIGGSAATILVAKQPPRTHVSNKRAALPRPQEPSDR